MLVLLPPSEGKAAGGSGAPLKPQALSLPGLAAARAAVLEELVELCVGDELKAREVLGLSEGLRGEVAKNAELLSAVARPAGRSTPASCTTRWACRRCRLRRGPWRPGPCWSSRDCGERSGSRTASPPTGARWG